ncbi:MAG: phytoene desaturase [Kiritimatiellia bacterium]|jgi:phytoene desaturase
MSDKVVVIGTGFGGLAAAIRMRAMGHDVVVVEANEQPGGRASVFHRDGFVFDAGPTVITAPYLFEELFRLVGRDPADYFQLRPVDPFYRVKWEDGQAFDFVGDDERMYSQIEQFDARDVDGYRKLVAHSEAIFDKGYTELADKPFHDPVTMLRVAPDLLRLENWRSVHGLVSKYINSDRLRQVFTFEPLLVGGNPYDTSSIYLLIHWLERKWGVHFAMGGTGELVRALTRLLNELGVPIYYNEPVEQIEVERGRAVAVRTNQRRIPCGQIVCNGDPSTVYEKLIHRSKRVWNPDWRINMRRQSPSLFVAYIGAKGTWEDTAHHTILLGQRYEHLLKDIFHRRILAKDFSLYLHAPGRTDPSLAPAGHDGFYVLSPIPNELSGIDWSEHAEPYLDSIVDYLDKGELPGLKDNLVTKFSVDARYFSGRLRSKHGAAFGLEPRLSQSAWFRYHNRSADVRGLYFVGAGTHPGGGLPGVLCSAKVVERLVDAPARPIALPAPARKRATA